MRKRKHESEKKWDEKLRKGERGGRGKEREEERNDEQ